MSTLTVEERRFGGFMLAMGVVYAIGGLSFWVLPGMNQWLAGLAGTALLSLPAGDPRPSPMWFALGVSMMFTIATASVMAGIDPRRHRPFALPVVVSKGASTAVAISALVSGKAEASALGVVLTDLPLFAITILLLRAAARSVNGSWLRAGPPQG